MIGVIVGIGYMIYLIQGGDRAEKHFYFQLFNEKLLLKHLIFGGITTAIGLSLVFFKDKFVDGFWFAPLLLIIFYKTADLITMSVNKRHLLIWARGDNLSKYKGNWLDVLLDILIFATTLGLCVFFSNL